MPEIVIRRNDRVLKIATLSLERGGEGFIYVKDAAGSGGSVVSGKVFQDAGNNVLMSFSLTGGLAVSLTIRSSYPIVLVNGIAATLLASGGAFEGAVIKTLALGVNAITAQVRTPNDGLGAKATVQAAVS